MSSQRKSKTTTSTDSKRRKKSTKSQSAIVTERSVKAPKKRRDNRKPQRSESEAKAGRTPAFRWTENRLAQIGTMPDSKLAKKLKIGTTTVYKKRKELGISPFGKSNLESQFKWTKRALKYLGKESDQKAAERLGISVSTVATKRRQLQIPSVRQQKGQRLGREARKWKAAEIKLLGKHADAWVAKKLKMGRRHVYAKRLELGIPSLTETVANQMWTPRRMEQLGQVPDRQLADEIGVTVATVSNRRQAMGIPSYRDQLRAKDTTEVLKKSKSRKGTAAGSTGSRKKVTSKRSVAQTSRGAGKMQKKSATKDDLKRPRRGK